MQTSPPPKRFRRWLIPCATCAVALLPGSAWSEELRVSSLDLSEMTQGWSVPGVNTSVEGKPIRIGGKAFDYGIGTHADSSLAIDLKRTAKRFSAQVGVDEEAGGTIEFTVVGDGKTLWTSGVMKGQEAAKAIDVDLTGIRKLTLRVTDAGDGNSSDHGDWADPVIVYQGHAPTIAPQTIPHIFSDNMVLQRDKPIPVWGWLNPGDTVQVSFGTQSKKATADAQGNWSVRLDPMPANKVGQDLTISGADNATYKNVLLGDVWVCSGQSNMEFGAGNSLNGNDEAKVANYPTIRFIRVPRLTGAFPQNDFKSSWQTMNPSTFGECTAVGYFFARELAKDLDVPIGLLHSNWGGTSIEPWINREGLAAVPELKEQSKRVNDLYPESEAGQRNFQDYIAKMKAWLPMAENAVKAKTVPPPFPEAPAGTTPNNGQWTNLYNAMIAPAVPYGIKGAIWYQGESNGGEGDTYFHKMEALVIGWRQAWKQGDFPFYWVQLANFQQSDPSKPEMGDGWARLREAQVKSLTIPNTGMAVITDIGEANDIHPKNKQDVGRRLAAWALAKAYGKAVEYSGPLFLKSAVEGDKIRITFDHAESGLMIAEKAGLDPVKDAVGKKLKWVSIAGEDKKFYWAEAIIDGKTLLVFSPMVTKPVAVRYNFTMNPNGPALYSKFGLPASPFRTDTW